VFKVWDNANYIPTGEKCVIIELAIRQKKPIEYNVAFANGDTVWVTGANLEAVEGEAPATAGEALVKGERQNDYGDPNVSFGRIAGLWSAHLGVNVTKRDVALMMVLMKVSREKSAHKEDNLADIEGYVYCARILKED
jgi:hypothetical protein